MAFDVSTDYLIFDWLETIQYFQRIDDVTFAGGQFNNEFDDEFDISSVSVDNCLRREIHKDNIYNNVDFSMPRVRWEIPELEIDINPKRGDLITDTEGFTWVVEKVDYCDKISRYRCECYISDHLIGTSL